MNKTDHTQGPWRVKVISNGKAFAIYSGKHCISTLNVTLFQGLAEKGANARLIALAPEMLEELCLTLECLDAFIALNGATPAIKERAKYISAIILRARRQS